MPNNAPKPPVISDVARRAGVSVPTVSRVLNGAAYVSEEKRKRVIQAIEELEFRPSAAARALVARQPKLIAVIAGNTSRYGYAETIRGVEERARAAGYTVTITVVESADDESVERAVSLLLDQPIAGVVVLKFDPPGVAALHRIPKSIPTVAISGVREPGVPQAVLAEADAAEEVVSYLLELGHKTVHHVRVPPSRKEDGRTTGWRRALVAHGAAVPPPRDASWEPGSGREIGRALAGDPAVTAVFCGNDEIAMGVIRGLADEGKSVPADVSVVGFDDHPLAQLWSPPLTTVDQDFAGLGSRGYDLLQTVIAGGRVRKFSSERPTVVIRESTAPPPA
ncbi:LacI family DNA-binding transcriptional regulator [Leifsonia sp. 2MCAF36]|uniref:LacI family DNA-binding transcriptional regulator n=1 Tax=Leifsonia sp. 2MCAF36 TaxID=3232988 RepID=UPI003F97F82D